MINASLEDVGLAGRNAELAVLGRVLSGAADAPHVVHLHGPGGIGKSALLRHTARRARLTGREVVHVDARYLNSDPRRLEEAAALACVEPGAVVLVDAFERCRRLEPWLRDTFLSRLAEGAVVVLASRTAPDVEWSLDPAWTRRFTGLDVRPLDAAASDALLAARGVAPDQRGAILSFAGGSPLVLTLAAPAPAARWKPTGDLLTTLLERLVGDVPSPVHRRGLDVLAQARVTRESLLRTVLGDEDAATVFSWLRRQPYVEAAPDGLRPHDAVRAALDADLRWRDPERHEEIRTRVSVTCPDAVRRAAEDDALPRVAESRLEPGDVPEVLRMAEEPAVAHAVPWTLGPPDRLPRKAFEEGVLEALRTWRAPREFATSVLLRSHLVPPGSADPVTDLRDAFTTAFDALRVDPAGVKAHDALVATYISASGTHKATARRLGVPYGTYRRHLALARERLVEHLLAR